MGPKKYLIIFLFGTAILHICILFFNTIIIFFMINTQIIPRDQKTEAIIFDLGGVLLNLDVQRSLDAFIDLGFEDIKEKMVRIMSKSSKSVSPGFFQLYETGRISSNQFRKEIRQYMGKNISATDIDRAWTAMLLDIPEANISLMEKLGKSFRLFLLSNTNALHIETLLGNDGRQEKFTRLIKPFEKIYYSHEIKMRKPDTEIFHYVIKDACLDPDTTIFIDDSLHNIEGASEAGLRVYHHKANESLEPLFP